MLDKVLRAMEAVAYYYGYIRCVLDQVAEGMSLGNARKLIERAVNDLLTDLDNILNE